MHVSVQPFSIENRHGDYHVQPRGGVRQQRRKSHVLIRSGAHTHVTGSRDTQHGRKNLFVHKLHAFTSSSTHPHFLSSALHLTLDSPQRRLVLNKSSLPLPAIELLQSIIFTPIILVGAAHRAATTMSTLPTEGVYGLTVPPGNMVPAEQTGSSITVSRHLTEYVACPKLNGLLMSPLKCAPEVSLVDFANTRLVSHYDGCDRSRRRN